MNLFPNRSFTRADAIELLGLPAVVIDALVLSGHLRPESVDGQHLIPAEQFEALFRDGLLSLYKAVATSRQPVATEAHEETEIDLDATDEEQQAVGEGTPPGSDGDGTQEERQPLIIEEEAEVEKPDLRRRPRFIPRRQIDGVFNRVRFSVVQISDSGLRIRHHEPLLAADEGKVSFALLNPPRSFLLKAKVVWTSIARYGEDQGTFWISGLRATEHADRLSEAMELLLEARQLEPDRRAKPRPAKVFLPPGGVAGASDEEVAEVIKVAHRFGADPMEATRWYARAKFALTDERVRRSAPLKMRDRDEVLAIWEYLDRRIEIAKVHAVVAWMRKTRPRNTSISP
jgi:hypothetical protein